MTVDYTIAGINAKLQGLADYIGAGTLLLVDTSTTLSTLTFASPCGEVDGGVLTFSGPLIDSAAVASGTVTKGQIYSDGGILVIDNLTVGIPLSGAEIVISNGLNSLAITAGQTVVMLSGQITGS